MTLEDVGPDNWRHCAALEVEMTLLIYPVVVGQGTRLFPATGPDTALDLVESRSTPSGVTIPDLPAHRAPAVRNGHARPAHLT
jgi:dihydrofolate reductase